jgi:SAM-dependent MidA family methyltransferase
MTFLPFDEYQKNVNSDYYSEKGKGVYGDFSTFAFGKGRLGSADALEFYEFAKKHSGELRVCEFGVGSGDFAKAFLDELGRLDASLYERISYSLVDVSERMLSDAMERVRGYSVESVHSDALAFETKHKFHYVRSNELLSDLPSKLLFRKGREIFQLGFEGKKLASRKYGKRLKALENFPEGYLFPLNIGAIEFLEKLPAMLAQGGYANIFDYGFVDFGEVSEEPREIWNENVSRLYGEQVTVDVNFAYLMELFPKMQVGSQKGYVERVLGEKLFQVQLEGKMYYLDKNELKRMRGKLKAEGYSEDFIRGEFEEESDYWHVRIEV